MFILGRTSRLVQALAIAGMSVFVRPSAAYPSPADSGYIQGEDDKSNDVDGEVQSYEPGKLLSIRKTPHQEVKFDLTKADTTYSIAPGVAKGSNVTVSDKKLGNGRHEVTVALKGKQQ